MKNVHKALIVFAALAVIIVFNLFLATIRNQEQVQAEGYPYEEMTLEEVQELANFHCGSCHIPQGTWDRAFPEFDTQDRDELAQYMISMSEAKFMPPSPVYQEALLVRLRGEIQE